MAATTLSAWQETREALQLWFQVVGKVRLALEPMVNHWWQVPLYVSSRGLTSSLMHADGRGIEVEFNFIGHTLDLRSSDGPERHVPLRSGSVASFYAETMKALSDLGVVLALFDCPVEMEFAVPFHDDDRDRAYEPEAAERFWHALIQAHRVMTCFRAKFIGKASPVHFFWGQPTSRPRGSPVVRHPFTQAECRTVPIGCSNWRTAMSCRAAASGPAEAAKDRSPPMPIPAPGFSEAQVEPDAAYYDENFPRFLLPYAAVREAEDPDAMLLQFFQSTYEAAAELAGWDRATLEMA